MSPDSVHGFILLLFWSGTVEIGAYDTPTSHLPTYAYVLTFLRGEGP